MAGGAPAEPIGTQAPLLPADEGRELALERIQGDGILAGPVFGIKLPFAAVRTPPHKWARHSIVAGDTLPGLIENTEPSAAVRTTTASITTTAKGVTK